MLLQPLQELALPPISICTATMTNNIPISRSIAISPRSEQAIEELVRRREIAATESHDIISDETGLIVESVDTITEQLDKGLVWRNTNDVAG